MVACKRISAVLLSGCLLAGCTTTGMDDPANIRFRLPAGSLLVLNQPLDIPEGRAHLMLQGGAAATAAGDFDVACRFEVRDLGPRTVQPDRFAIRSMSSGRRWINQPHSMRFYKVFRLQSDTQADILPMECGYTDDPRLGRPVTVQQIQEALGPVFTIEFPPAATP